LKAMQIRDNLEIREVLQNPRSEIPIDPGVNDFIPPCFTISNGGMDVMDLLFQLVSSPIPFVNAAAKLCRFFLIFSAILFTMPSSAGYLPSY